MSGSARGFPKVAIVISNLFHARSALETPLILSLQDSFEVVVFCTKEVFESYKGILSQQECRFFQIDERAEILSNRIMNAGAFRFQGRSKSFRYRVTRRIRESTRVSKKSVSIFYLEKLSQVMIWLKLFIDGWILYQIYLIPKYRKTLDFNSNFLRLFQEVNPAAAIIWSQSMEPSSSSAVRFSRELRIPSILIADNWDNLFSKTVLVEKSDFIGCFGMQGVEFGSKLHGVPAKNIIPLGSARFEIYRDQQRVFRNKNTILFAGSSMLAEDERVLRVLLKVKERLEESEGNSTGLIWKYRPHPFPQQSRTNLAGILEEFKDLQVESMEEMNGSARSWPRLADSLAELASTRIAVCMPTSYLLEVRINSVKVIVPAFEDNLEITSCKTLLSNLEHLNGLGELAGVNIASSEGEIESRLIEGIRNPEFPPPDQSLDWFVQWSGDGFTENLRVAIKKAIR
jgi:hypothetical protein